MAGGHVTLSHGSSSALQTCEPRTASLTESSICQQDQTTLHVEEDKVFLHVGKRSQKNYPAESESLPPDGTQ